MGRLLQCINVIVKRKACWFKVKYFISCDIISTFHNISLSVNWFNKKRHSSISIHSNEFMFSRHFSSFFKFNFPFQCVFLPLFSFNSSTIVEFYSHFFLYLLHKYILHNNNSWIKLLLMLIFAYLVHAEMMTMKIVSKFIYF